MSVKKRRRPGMTNLCVLIPTQLHRQLKSVVEAQGTTLQAWLPPLLEAAIELEWNNLLQEVSKK